MTDDRIIALEREVAKLRAEIADVKNATKIISNDTTRHICSINEQLAVDGSWLTRLIYKVLPEYAGTRAQIDRIFNPDRSASEPEKPT